MSDGADRVHQPSRARTGAPRDVEGDGRRLRLRPRRCRARAPLRARTRRPRRGHAADGPHRRDAGARAPAVARARVDPSWARVGGQHHRRWHQARIHARQARPRASRHRPRRERLEALGPAYRWGAARAGDRVRSPA